MSGARGRHDWNRRPCCPGSDLGFFRSHGREAAAMSRPRDLADGEREAFSHGRGSRNDDC